MKRKTEAKQQLQLYTAERALFASGEKRAKFVIFG